MNNNKRILELYKQNDLTIEETLQLLEGNRPTISPQKHSAYNSRCGICNCINICPYPSYPTTSPYFYTTTTHNESCQNKSMSTENNQTKSTINADVGQFVD
jgi:hypothetical protein